MERFYDLDGKRYKLIKAEPLLDGYIALEVKENER